MKDLSSMLDIATALTAGSSMSGGNTISNNELAMSAPGSVPVNPDPTTPTKVDDPGLSQSDTATVSDGASRVPSHDVTNSDASWKKV